MPEPLDDKTKSLIEEAKAELAAQPPVRSNVPPTTPTPPTPPPIAAPSKKRAVLDVVLAAGFVISLLCGAFAGFLTLSLMNAANSGSADVGLLALPFLPLFAGLPYLLLGGAICGIALAVRSKSRWRKIAMAATVAVLLVVDGWYSYAQHQASQKSKAQDKEFHRVMGRDEMLGDIAGCQVDSFTLDKGTITVTYSNNQDAAGNWVYKAEYADPKYYADYVAKAKSVAGRCAITYINQDTGNNDPTSQGTRWVSAEEATSGLNACQIKTFNYATTIIDGPPKGTDTGIELVDYGFVKHIWVAPAQESTMIPVARAAQKKCDGAPQFFHDGAYEQTPPSN